MKAEIFEASVWVKETRPDVLMAACEKMLLESGFKIVEKAVHFFSPQGFTAVFILAESHLAIHTFPEEGKSYVQLSSCVERYYNKFWGDFFLECDPG